MIEKKEILKITDRIAELVYQKNKAYGDSFFKSSEILKQLYPDGISPDKYGDMLTIIRILDKLFRIATDKDALGESPYQDILGYSLLGVLKDKKKQNETVKDKSKFRDVEKEDYIITQRFEN
jgi:hypothetical protein